MKQTILQHSINYMHQATHRPFKILVFMHKLHPCIRDSSSENEKMYFYTKRIRGQQLLNSLQDSYQLAAVFPSRNLVSLTRILVKWLKPCKSSNPNQKHVILKKDRVNKPYLKHLEED